MGADVGSQGRSESSTTSPFESIAEPHVTNLRLALAPWTVHFKTPGYIKEETMQMIESTVVKKTLDKTRLNPDIRKELGTQANVWRELGELLEAASPSLEKRCFATTDPASPEFDVLSGQLIAANFVSLLKDLERLHSMVCIARNILTIGDKAQSQAAHQHFDQEVFKLISICVKVTARGYDGEPGSGEEDKWQSVINSFKKLLITCLQFINNLVARNERRKVMLWIELFDSSSENGIDQASGGSSTALASTTNSEHDEEFKKNLISISKGIHIQSEAALPPNKLLEPASSPFILYIGRIGWEVKKELLDNEKPAGAGEVAAECQRRWNALSDEERKRWDEVFKDVVQKYRKEVPKFIAEQEASLTATNVPTLDSNAATLARSIQKLQGEVERMKKSIITVPQSPSVSSLTPKSVDMTFDMNKCAPLAADLTDPPPPQAEDFEMDVSSKYGADILQQGKDDLIRRLESYNDRTTGQPAQIVAEDPHRVSSPGVPVSQDLDDGADLSEEEDSDEDDYVIPGDDGRGLLTDVPLILGPTEIEVLPMIIMSGIVPPAEGSPGYGDDPMEIAQIKHLHAMRCHLLLAQENGRNLLRELLIFVAAWDLRDDELYFKFMVKIMEAILTNALMPFSYHAFKESKDIISPAQAVIMKLLTNIFKQRQSSDSTNKAGNKSSLIENSNEQQAYPMQVDVQMVRFLLTEFRKNIIPQTCALIFLQGQIRAGFAAPDDFPLNLWDMERMYEGVYQYLEFFAILTEADVWKIMMAGWDITSELVTLLKELDSAIPKGQLPGPPLLRQQNNPITPTPTDVQTAQNGGASKYNSATVTTEPGLVPIAIERPYDLSTSEPPGTGNVPVTAPVSNPMPPGPFITDVSNFSNASPTDEPSDFEWRNLKKLTVLVLSSLTWHSHKVQDQVREHGGIHAVLNCCAYDEHNPYIREHAIMCLRFLLEGNRANQDVVRELEARGVVPNEVLDQHGYETFMDARGQVGLRRKVAPSQKQHLSAATSQNRQLKQQELVDAVSQTHPHLPATAAAAAHAAAIASGASSSDAALFGATAAAAAKTALPKDPGEIAEFVQQVMQSLPTRVESGRAETERAAVAKLDRRFEGDG